MFTWDPQKAILNYEKHGVSFKEASTVFDDARALDWADLEHSDAESRFKRLGMSNALRVLIVVYSIQRIGKSNEEIRVISARRASRKEEKAYFGKGYRSF